MSVEMMRYEERPCLCGKGTWATWDMEDDWCHSHSYSKIMCPECEKTCEIRYFPHHKPCYGGFYKLVPKEE